MTLHGRAALILVLLAETLGGCLGGPAPESAPDASPIPTPPSWSPGDWWQYRDSDGITYTYTYGARETKEGFDAYRVRIDRSEPDELDFDQYTMWYSAPNMGLVASQKGGFYGKFECSLDDWFPLNHSFERSCNMTTSHGGFSQTSKQTSVKTATGWDEVSVPAGTFYAFTFEFRSQSSDNRPAKSWYSADVKNLVQYTITDGAIHRLVAFGSSTSSPPAG